VVERAEEALRDDVRGVFVDRMVAEGLSIKGH
jgi:hypothetical protein